MDTANARLAGLLDTALEQASGPIGSYLKKTLNTPIIGAKIKSKLAGLINMPEPELQAVLLNAESELRRVRLGKLVCECGALATWTDPHDSEIGYCSQHGPNTPGAPRSVGEAIRQATAIESDPED